jgi:hypothetical protein
VIPKGSFEMPKNYKELKVWQKSFELCVVFLIESFQILYLEIDSYSGQAGGHGKASAP